MQQYIFIIWKTHTYFVGRF